MRAFQLAIWSSLGTGLEAAYVWPSKQDFIEDLWAMQSGVVRFGFTDLVVPCGFGSNEVGKQTSAEWIRTVFHDTITHDKAAGTGGLDASITFETERAENEGNAFNNTLAELIEFYTPRSSASDLLALSLVASVASCGGHKIPLRTGRIDATEAGPLGVPKPDQDLESTMEAFTKAGFSQSDMIALVACGHTVGGVHSTDFPDIVEGEASDENKGEFDRTEDIFDTAVVDEYLANDGINPLVFGRNDTTNSDKRIFGSDGNSTISSLSDPDTFKATCADVFERMINTVPSTVKLSDPIEIVEVKPYIDTFEFSAANSSKLTLVGRVRVRTTERSADDLTVALDILHRNGERSKLEATLLRVRGGKSYGFYGEEFAWFDFATEIDPKVSIKAFDVHLGKGTSGDVEVFDNAGTGGFPVNDGLLFVGSQSCLDTTDNNGNFTATIQAAVRKDLAEQAEAPIVQLAHEVQQPGSMLPRLVIEGATMEKTSVTKAGYEVYSVAVPIEMAGWSTVFDIELRTADDVLVSEFHRTNSLSTTC